MDPSERAALEDAGFWVGDAEDFLGLTEAERNIVELRVRLGRWIRAAREAQGLTQREMASRLKLTQPKLARVESAAPEVSVDLMVRGFFDAGGTTQQLAALLTMGDLAELARAGLPKRPVRKQKTKTSRAKVQ